MIHDKEIELQILKKITETSRVTGDNFQKMFDNWSNYAVIFRRLVTHSYITERIEKIDGRDQYTYQLNEYGEQKRKNLEKEKADEISEKEIQKKLIGDSKTVSGWTIFLGIVGFLTLLATIYLIYLEFHPPVSKAMTPEQQIQLQKSWDSLAKDVHDSTSKNVMDTINKRQSTKIDSVRPTKKAKVNKSYPDTPPIIVMDSIKK